MSATIDAPPEPAPEHGGSHLPFPVVGVGASAGCVGALVRLFEKMPVQPGMAFVVVVHLSPEHESNIDAILGRVTPLQVLQVRKLVPIEPDHVYVISPALQLSMEQGHLQVEPLARERGPHMAIDVFFRTLAEAQRERAYCIVLSGTGSDGTLGLRRVKECGGVALVQSPGDAEYDGMPNSAIATGVADFVLPAADMGAKLTTLWDNLQRIELPRDLAEKLELAPPPSSDAAAAAESALADVMRLVRARTGHDFSHYKRSTVLRRIERRLQVNSVPTLPDYRDLLVDRPEEAQALLKDLLISVTNFFRDREAYDVLEVQVQKALFDRPEARTQLRAWVAGCATGEEAYSVAMLLAEKAENQSPEVAIQVFASDIDEKAIAQARAGLGLYPDTIVADVTPARLRQFFQKEQGQLRVRKELRDRILFAAHNQLHGSLGESAASNEDLRASNEELQAINEELRSTTEELETSREELQSVNEQLVTVNQELRSNIEETAKANDDLENLIASTDIATVFVDRGMRIKRFTPRASQLFNLIGTDVGRSLLDITHRLDYDQLGRDAQQAFESLRTIEREIKGEDGSFWLARALPYRTGQDVIDGAVLNFIDVSAIRRAQAQLSVGEENLRRVVESTQDYAVITIDTERKVTAWNAGAARLFGFARDEMMGQPIDVIFTPGDRAAGAPQDEVERARELGRAQDDRWHVAKGGRKFFCSGTVTPIHEEGELVGFAKIARDLTDRRRVEEKLESLLAKEKETGAELQRAFALKDEFLAVMSHELMHPLNLIQVNADLLLRMPQVRAEPAIANVAEVIRRAVLGQAKVIDDLLDLSRVRTGKLTLSRSPVPWADVIAHVRDAFADAAAARQITLETELDATTIDADPVRAEQIVWNLLSNALKFTPPGGSVKLRLSVDSVNEEFARLDVVDTGQGIAPDFLDQLFDMFRQADRSRSRQQGGMGIGLSLAKQLVEAHGGRVAAQSKGVGQGTTFSVWLPLADAAAPRSDKPQSSPLLAGLRLLVVDDSADALESLATLLGYEGAEVTAVGDGPAALAKAAEHSFHLVLSDIAMPGMDGYELIGQLRKSALTPQVPAIALTGFRRSQDAKQALEAGFDAHVGKPVAIEKLLEAIRQLHIPRQ